MKILFFAPHSAIWVHAFPEALVAEALQQNGHKIVYASCGRQFQRHCVPMSAHGLVPGASRKLRSRVCDNCETNDDTLRREFALNGPRLAALVGPEDEKAIEASLSAVTRESFRCLELDGVPVGNLALYQIMLRRKRIDLEFSEEEWCDYLVELRNTLYAGYAGRKLLDTEKPDRVLVYNALYSVNRIVCRLAEKRGIPTYFMHAGGNLSHRLQTLILGRGDTFQFMPHIVDQWPRFSEIPCSGRLLESVTDHYLELLRGRSIFVYSTTKVSNGFDLRSRFGLGKDQKLLVATMSSYDEEVAAEMVGAREHHSVPLFATQADWIRALVEFVSDRPDLFLLVRVHPREFPNRRENVLSQHARVLQRVLADLPDNVAANWPSDNISLYDLADQTDVFLNSWSSAGKEMSLLGIPVVLYSRELAAYPPQLNSVGTSLETYFAAVNHALQEGWDVERARRAYRWGVFEFSRATVFIGDSYPEIEDLPRSMYQKVVGRIRRRLDPFFKEHADCSRRRTRLKAAAQINLLIESGKDSIVDSLDPSSVERADLDEETRCLWKELGRLRRALFPDDIARPNSRLYAALNGPIDRA